MTYGQKFLLLIETDSFFQSECKYLVKEWSISKDKKYFDTSEDLLPVDYKKDLNFVLLQFGLPERFFMPLHKYLLSGKKPNIKTLPNPVHIFIRTKRGKSMGKVVIEADPDVSKQDLIDAYKNISESKEFLKLINQSERISQPIRNFEQVLKNVKEKSNIQNTAEKETDWNASNEEIGASIRRIKSKLHTQRSKYKKVMTDSHRIPVSKRIDYEKEAKEKEKLW